MAIQTPKQRIANERFYKRNQRNLGKSRNTQQSSRLPLSKTWIVVLLFLLIGGGVLQLVSLLL
ncbi:LAMI_0E06634g1_1 [Lachancea mirantina]|uniref:Stress-associated endoplasmic reticulum protein n=1 Tax=Lachancea mirantina TaxID=1230905 RepID=A0A1G4JLY9_9SACH|nr:LAMI_0E06634g1_1 [Lachancea mirantina]